MESPRGPRRYDVLVPLKPLASAKSRLAPLGPDARVRLARAFAADTVTAALKCAEIRSVTVVTADLRLREDATDLGAGAVDDPVPGDLNEALRRVVAHGRADDAGVLVLCGDLPALRPEELTWALGMLPGTATGFVPDAAGAGTTAYVAVDRADFAPAFGAGSRRTHAASGARELCLDRDAGLRRDVDTPEDLDEVLSLGPGARTLAVLARLGLPGPPHASGPAPTGTDPD